MEVLKFGVLAVGSILLPSEKLGMWNSLRMDVAVVWVGFIDSESQPLLRIFF